MKKERENRTVGWCGSGDGGEKLFDLVVLEKSLVLLGLLRWRPRPLTAVLVLAAALVHPVEESGIAAAPLVAAVGGVACNMDAVTCAISASAPMPYRCCCWGRC
jgi:hypothetical protein